jgi:transcriptional regulator with XRE-family HTH domain
MGLTKNFAEVIRRKLAVDNDLAAAVDAERFNINVSSVIHEARSAAGLTQQQLAERVGMHQSAIARLEDADYDGHSLKTLERIAFAFGKRIEIRFVEQSAAAQPPLTDRFVFDSLNLEETTASFSPPFLGAGVIYQPDGTILQAPLPQYSASTSVVALPHPREVSTND